MKKLIILAFIAFYTVNAQAQKANIQSAINYLKDKDVANAKKMIDEAVKSESTINNAKAWFLKGLIYQAIGTPSTDQMPFITFIVSSTAGENAYPVVLESANQFASSTPDALDQSFEAYKKSIELNSKYEKEEYVMLLPSLISSYYNNGISLINENKFNDAFNSLEKMSKFKTLDGGKLFGEFKLDTLFANARWYQGICVYQTGKDDEALTILEECIKNPITQSLDIYIMATDIYQRKMNDAKWMETMKLAKAKYPSDKRLINSEINYYSSIGKSDLLIKSLKDGIAAEPGKADLYLSLGETYYNMANPLDKAKKSLPKPVNAKELEQNAFSNYTKAAELDPKNAYAQFYLGLFHYNKAKELTDAMNIEKDNNKYAAMKPERNATIEKALPFLDKTRSLCEAEGINDSNKEMYKQALSGLTNAYMIIEKNEKSAEIQKVLSGVK
jgi:tetratricopeptide (TPR) repeat protein